MGNQQTSEQLKLAEKPPTLQIMRSAIRLKTHNGQYTKSFINSRFSTNLSRVDSGDISRQVNPFCVVQLKFDDQSKPILWSTACMISPLMAMTFPKMVGAQNGTGKFSLKISGMTKEVLVQSKVKQTIRVQVSKGISIAVFVLEKPIWQIGWVGVSFLQNHKEIKETLVKLVNHPERTPVANKKERFHYKQHVKRIIPVCQESFIALHKDRIGSLVFTVNEKKPYVIGVQYSQEQIIYFSRDSFIELKEKTANYLTLERQKEALKSIDLLGAEMEIQW